MRLRIGDAWFHLNYCKHKVPDAMLYFFSDVESGVLLGRVTEEWKERIGDLREKVLEALEKGFDSWSYHKLGDEHGELKEVEDLFESEPDRIRDNKNIVWEET